jgi:hypothetical protein
MYGSSGVVAGAGISGLAFTGFQAGAWTVTASVLIAVGLAAFRSGRFERRRFDTAPH